MTARSRNKDKIAKVAKLAANVPPGDQIGPGSILGNWRVIKKLGAGGMGAVFEVRHTINGRRAAVKLLHSSLKDPEYTRLFLRESRIDNLVDSAVRRPVSEGAGAVRVYDNGYTSEGTPFLVMELLEGVPISSLLQGPVPFEGVGAVLNETLRVLEGAHDNGVIHRDIKPENLFVTNERDIRVLDFGLAQMPSDKPHIGHASGTLGYAPPEQVLGLPATPSSDVWSVGATGYTMLTGHLPVDPSPDKLTAALEQLDSEQLMAIAAGRKPLTSVDTKALGCPVLPVRRLAPATPPALAKVIDKALKCNPEERYQTAHAMRQDLRLAMESELARAHLAESGTEYSTRTR